MKNIHLNRLTLFRKKIILILFIFANSILLAQHPNQLTYEGNKAFKKNDMQTAINKYNEALKIKPNTKKAIYNLGNALYKEALTLKFSNATAININNKDSIANLMLQRSAELYSSASQLYKNKDSLQKIYHNLGNAYLFQKKYTEAIDAYKKSLKLNPNDEDTRYNLAYALKHKNDNKGGGSNNQQQQNQSQNQQQQQINKEQAERMLQTLIQKEKELQDKKKEQQAAGTAKPEKDW
ncbi:MAG: tetratricopeptide repeat protein [Bacteroidia bacterium]|nr:tetratricopeptide repeat protein [Bacteroidia bacterium]